MIYDVFLPFLIIFSIFGIIIILARKIPEISLESEIKSDLQTEEAKKQHRTAVLFCKSLSILEKALRQMRIHILKLDAKIFGLIEYLRQRSANKLEEINKLSYKTFTPALEKKANKISKKFQFKLEERKLIYTIAKDPKNAENYKKLGMLYLGNKNFFDAEAAFKEYLKLNPSDGQAEEILKQVVFENQKEKI